MIKWRPAAPRSLRAPHRALQIRPKQFEIDHRTQRFQGIALGRELLQPLLNIKKPCLPPHLRPPASTQAIESQTTLNSQVIGGLQFEVSSDFIGVDRGFPRASYHGL